MISENKASVFDSPKKTSKKILFSLSERNDIFVIKFCKPELF